MSRISRWIAYTFGGLASLAILGAIYQAMASQRDSQKYPPPGKLVDVGGYCLHVNCMGKGSPAVVLDSGLSHGALAWSLVQPKVAEFTQVCSYDRAGCDWSDPGPKPRTSRQIAHELHTLLQNANIPGPYILVGHSFGGLNVRVFASEYPDEVAGMVLVDAAHEDQRVRMPHYPFKTRLVHNLQWQWFRLHPLWARLGILRLINRPNFVYGQPPEVQEIATAIGLQSGAYDWIFGDAAAIEESEEQVRAIGSLGDLPLTVLSAHMDDGALDQVWQELQIELTQLSSNATHIMARKGGHCLHIDEPELVVKAIQQVVEAVQGSA